MIVLSVILLLLILFNMLSVKADTMYCEKKFRVIIKLGKIVLYSSDKNKKNDKKTKETEKPSGGGKEKDKKTKKKKITVDRSSLPDMISDIVGILKYIPGKIRCVKLILKIRYSSGDAATTGETCGAFWAAFGMLFSPAAKVFRFETDPEVSFTPLFDEKVLEIYYKGIFKLRIYHILILGIMTMFKLKKYIKFKAVDKNGRTASN